MAKLSAKGCYKVAGWRVAIPDNIGADPEHETWYYKYALRSDGALLRSTARSVHGAVRWNDGGTYSTLGKVKAGKGADDVQGMLERKHGAANVTRTA